MSGAVTAHVARLYFDRGLTKSEIAARLGLSRFRVARLLDQARTAGIVRIEIRDELAIDEAAGEALQSAYGLRLALVAREHEEIAAVAAAWLPHLLRRGEVVGTAWGATLQAVVERLPALDAGVTVVQVCGAVPGLEPGTGPVELTLRFAERLCARAVPLPAPALASPAARDELLANDAVRPTVELFPLVSTALVGIGPPVRELRLPRRAVGHVLVHAFARDGRLLESGLPERAIALGVDDLRRTRVVAVAGGPGKELAVAGALRTGLLDVLVTDALCAEAALART
jgi:DNA-binding transcriptional regulator LsrR (DeoR family)